MLGFASPLSVSRGFWETMLLVGTAVLVALIIAGALLCAATTGAGMTGLETPLLKSSCWFRISVLDFTVPLSSPWELVESDRAKEEHCVSVPTERQLIVKSKLKKRVLKMPP